MRVFAAAFNALREYLAATRRIYPLAERDPPIMTFIFAVVFMPPHSNVSLFYLTRLSNENNYFVISIENSYANLTRNFKIPFGPSLCP